MPQDLIRYDLLVQDALKSVVRKVLIDAAANGMPGDHHFYISFRTGDPGVRVSQRLREKWPDEMTIILQHQFWDLGVTEHTFEVGLSFSGIPERLLIPFDALTGFFDPSVQFGLKFELPGSEASAKAAAALESDDEDDEPAPAPAALPRPSKLAPAEAKTARRNAKSEDEAVPPEPKADEPAKPDAGAAVVSLDAFRKKT